jgi:hypothetical protein
MAYCMLGILDTSMPVIYDKGKKKAQDRLRAQLQFKRTAQHWVLDEDTLPCPRDWLCCYQTLNPEQQVQGRDHDCCLATEPECRHFPAGGNSNHASHPVLKHPISQTGPLFPASAVEPGRISVRTHAREEPAIADLQMVSLIRRPALGEKVGIGALHDARKDHFLPDRLLNPYLSEAALETINELKVYTDANYGDSHQKRFTTFGIPTELSGSILAESVRCGGASWYLMEQIEARSIHAALGYTVHACSQTLDFRFAGLRDYLTATTVSNPDATHAVVGVE